MEYLLYGLGLYLGVGVLVAAVSANKPPPAPQRSKFGRMLAWPLVVAGK